MRPVSVTTTRWCYVQRGMQTKVEQRAAAANLLTTSWQLFGKQCSLEQACYWVHNLLTRAITEQGCRDKQSRGRSKPLADDSTALQVAGAAQRLRCCCSAAAPSVCLCCTVPLAGIMFSSRHALLHTHAQVQQAPPLSVLRKHIQT